MILIITTNHDQVTSRICMWLLHYKKKFRLVSDQDLVNPLRIEGESMTLENLTRNYKLDLNCVHKILYRQGDIILSAEISKTDDKNLINYILNERRNLQQFLYYKIDKIPHLGHPELANMNKLIVLEKAVQFDLSVPEYIFTTNKSDVLRFYSKHNEIVTKIISPGYRYEEGHSVYRSYTELITISDLENLENNIQGSFFQRFIRKKLDIRTFYLNGAFYSVAIVSQNNVQTKIDFRNYDKQMPNRNLPFQLPKKIEQKLQNLITNLSLNYCSVDFVYGEDKEFYFLEINPIGQFGHVSYAGNYYLEKRLAELLCA